MFVLLLITGSFSGGYYLTFLNVFNVAKLSKTGKSIMQVKY